MSEPVQVVWHPRAVRRARGCVVWFTGLSGSGKSTVANRVEERLAELGAPTYLLDGDNVRHGLNASPALLAPRHGEAFARRFGLGFSAEDREENIRRVGAVAELFCDAGLIVLTAFVSPYRRDRQRVREQTVERGAPGDFVEVFVDTPLAVCEARDPKGLYRQAREGKLPFFTGVSDPYEPPEAPELVLSGTAPPDDLAEQVVGYLRSVAKLGDAPPRPAS